MSFIDSYIDNGLPDTSAIVKLIESGRGAFSGKLLPGLITD